MVNWKSCTCGGCLCLLCLIFDIRSIKNHIDQSQEWRWYSILLAISHGITRQLFSNISLRTTSAARARCIASLSWSQAFFRADPMFFWTVRSVSLLSLNLFFSLVLWIRLSKVTPICSSLSLYSLTKSLSLRTADCSHHYSHSPRIPLALQRLFHACKPPLHHYPLVRLVWLCCTMHRDIDCDI